MVSRVYLQITHGCVPPKYRTKKVSSTLPHFIKISWRMMGIVLLKVFNLTMRMTKVGVEVNLQVVLRVVPR